MISLCQLPPIRECFSGLVFESSAEGAALHRKSLRIEHTCTGTTSAGVERGERNISLINIIELAHALSVNPGELLKGIVRVS